MLSDSQRRFPFGMYHQYPEAPLPLTDRDRRLWCNWRERLNAGAPRVTMSRCLIAAPIRQQSARQNLAPCACRSQRGRRALPRADTNCRRRWRCILGHLWSQRWHAAKGQLLPRGAACACDVRTGAGVAPAVRAKNRQHRRLSPPQEVPAAVEAG